MMWLLADPRTERFSLNPIIFFSPRVYPNNTLYPGSGLNNCGVSIMPSGAAFSSSKNYPQAWDVNFTTSSQAFYSDPDGVVRPGDGIYQTANTGDGMLLFSTSGSPTGGGLYAAGDTGNTQHGRRPVILNRPFRSVGELGYTFRDLPFKTLDFFTQYSADAALLDVFSVTDESRIAGNQLNSVVAGKVNLNNAPAPVIQAILAGGAKKEIDPTYNLTAAQAKTIAQNIVSQLNSNPILSRAGLVTTQLSGTMQAAFASSPDKGNKAYLESPVRALADAVNTRTWNLMIDVVAQTGVFPSGAPFRIVIESTSSDAFFQVGRRALRAGRLTFDANRSAPYPPRNSSRRAPAHLMQTLCRQNA